MPTYQGPAITVVKNPATGEIREIPSLNAIAIGMLLAGGWVIVQKIVPSLFEAILSQLNDDDEDFYDDDDDYY